MHAPQLEWKRVMSISEQGEEETEKKRRRRRARFNKVEGQQLTYTRQEEERRASRPSSSFWYNHASVDFLSLSLRAISPTSQSHYTISLVSSFAGYFSRAPFLFFPSPCVSQERGRERGGGFHSEMCPSEEKE